MLSPLNLFWLVSPLLLLAGHWQKELANSSTTDRLKYILSVSYLTFIGFNSILMTIYLLMNPIHGPSILLSKGTIHFPGWLNLSLYLLRTAFGLATYSFAIGIAGFKKNVVANFSKTGAIIALFYCFDLLIEIFLKERWKFDEQLIGDLGVYFLLFIISLIAALLLFLGPFILILTFIQKQTNISPEISRGNTFLPILILVAACIFGTISFALRKQESLTQIAVNKDLNQPINPLDFDFSNCTQDKSPVPPGVMIAPNSQYPLNGTWKLDGIECHQGQLSKNGALLEKQIKTGLLSDIFKQMNERRLSKTQFFKSENNEAEFCNLCTVGIAEFALAESRYFISDSYSDLKNFGSINCQKPRPGIPRSRSYKIEGAVLRIYFNNDLDDSKPQGCEIGNEIYRYKRQATD